MSMGDIALIILGIAGLAAFLGYRNIGCEDES